MMLFRLRSRSVNIFRFQKTPSGMAVRLFPARMRVTRLPELLFRSSASISEIWLSAKTDLLGFQNGGKH